MEGLELRAGEVHVWVADLDVTPAALAAYAALLAADEHERAGRLRFEHLRVRFVAGRGILRRLLGEYLHTPPERIAFAYSSYGKPSVAAPAAPLPFAFNLAHSQNIAVYAFARAPRVGVDVEQAREVIERDQIVERFFSPLERQALAAVLPAQREEAFYLGWTRKEAYLKALGAGITYPLDRFSVSLTPGEAPALLQAADLEDGRGHWTLLAFEPGAGVYAAAAVEGRGWSLHCHSWDSSLLYPF